MASSWFAAGRVGRPVVNVTDLRIALSGTRNELKVLAVTEIKITGLKVK